MTLFEVEARRNGESSNDLLRALTTAPAERFGYAARKGRVAQGMDADFVLLDADPAQDPTAFARVRDTIRLQNAEKINAARSGMARAADSRPGRG